jgi:hypothetical protein
MRTRALLPVSVFLALVLGAYACDNGTFNNEVPVYNPGEGGTGFTEDTGTDAPSPTDASIGGDAGGGDAASKDGGGAGDAGEGGSPNDAPSDSSDLDAADASG